MNALSVGEGQSSAMTEHVPDPWDTEPEVWEIVDSGSRRSDLPEDTSEEPVDNVDWDDEDADVAPCAWSHRSVLGAVDTAFRLLTTDPDPLTVDGALLGHDLPARLIALAPCKPAHWPPRR